MPPSPRAMEVYSHLRRSLGAERPSVTQYHSDDRELSVDVMKAAECPAPGLVTLATLGLSDFPNPHGEGDVRVELLLAAPPDIAAAANILATTAMDVVRGPFPGAWPGALKPKAIERNAPEAALPDVLLVSPFCWQELDALPDVYFLQAIPIHTSEAAYCLKEGSDALQGLFKEHHIDVFDWERPAVV